MASLCSSAYNRHSWIFTGWANSNGSFIKVPSNSSINIINVFTTQQDNQVNVSIEFSVPLNPDTIEILNFDFRIGD